MNLKVYVIKSRPLHIRQRPSAPVKVKSPNLKAHPDQTMFALIFKAQTHILKPSTHIEILHPNLKAQTTIQWPKAFAK